MVHVVTVCNCVLVPVNVAAKSSFDIIIEMFFFSGCIGPGTHFSYGVVAVGDGVFFSVGGTQQVACMVVGVLFSAFVCFLYFQDSSPWV